MPENICLEELSAEKFNELPAKSMVKSRAGNMVVIKHRLYWEVFCRARFKSADHASRYLCVIYNELPLGKVFGRAVNSYANYLTAQEVAADHFHLRFKEIFRVESLEHHLTVTLADPKTGERVEFDLDGRLVEFDGQQWLREIVIPEGVAHRLTNPSPETVAVTVTTSGQHDADDVFPYAL